MTTSMYIGPFCEKCDAPATQEDDYDTMWCESCLTNAAEAAWERHCEDFHDGGSTAPWPETERLRSEAARRLK